MDIISDSCLKHNDYPQNLFRPDALCDNTTADRTRLTLEEDRLFDKSDASVELMDLDRGVKGEYSFVSLSQPPNE
jgi:hypothetical protein